MKKITLINVATFLLFSILTVEGQTTNFIQVSESDFESVQLNGNIKNNIEISSRSNSKEKNTNKRFFEIAYKKFSTIYVENGNIKKVSEEGNPIKLKSDDLQLQSLLNSSNNLFESIELITVDLKQQSDLSKSINVSNLTEFKNLKYIFVKCYFECSADQIRRLILNSNPEITVYYILTNQS
jgi:hypothetical protein